MKCAHCHSKKTVQRPQKTQLDYNEYRCRACGRQFNERTGTVYNFLTHRTEVIVLAVRYYYEFSPLILTQAHNLTFAWDSDLT